MSVRAVGADEHEGASTLTRQPDQSTLGWFLEPQARANPSTVLDARHTGLLAWTTGNEVRALVHGAVYFLELFEAVEAMGPGDRLMFTDWRGDPDERLTGLGSEVGQVFAAAAAARGVDVRGLVWRSHWDRFQFSASENRHLGDEIDAAGGQCLLDMRVRPMGSHHQKLVVLRHPRHPERDVAFIGGIDLCHSRRDDVRHFGDPQRQQMAAVYGARPPWHDVQLALRGPAVGDAETVFRERWESDPPHRGAVAPGGHQGSSPSTSAARSGVTWGPGGPIAAHLPGSTRRLPVRSRWRAQRGSWIP
jgi:phosphatidylserine/phosphatidylglycerophosphate/cardiolipin synthase-like enzyme